MSNNSVISNDNFDPSRRNTTENALGTNDNDEEISQWGDGYGDIYRMKGNDSSKVALSYIQDPKLSLENFHVATMD